MLVVPVAVPAASARLSAIARYSSQVSKTSLSAMLRNVAATGRRTPGTWITLARLPTAARMVCTSSRKVGRSGADCVDNTGLPASPGGHREFREIVHMDRPDAVVATSTHREDRAASEQPGDVVRSEEHTSELQSLRH